jgi:exodeoxyribonuclease V alpha subunit
MTTKMDFRVTSVYQYDKKWVCFSGVPLQTGSFKAKTAKCIVVVKTKPDILPMEPVTDQHWRIVVIDEASMVDLGTMYRIVLHTNPSVRFLFVGDPNQLPWQTNIY